MEPEHDLWILSDTDEDEQGEELARSMVAQHFPDVFSFRTPCPHCLETRPTSMWSDGKSSLFAVVIHLNDRHKWDRNRVADWLETLDVDLSFKVPEERPW